MITFYDFTRTHANFWSVTLVIYNATLHINFKPILSHVMSYNFQKISYPHIHIVLMSYRVIYVCLHDPIAHSFSSTAKVRKLALLMNVETSSYCIFSFNSIFFHKSFIEKFIQIDSESFIINCLSISKFWKYRLPNFNTAVNL